MAVYYTGRKLNAFGFLIHGVEGPFTYDIKLSILHTYVFNGSKSGFSFAHVPELFHTKKVVVLVRRYKKLGPTDTG
jgi:hypothetical protein